MKERPIIFSAPVVRAILSGAKTQAMLNDLLDDAALKAAAAKLRRLRLTDVGGDKEHPSETVKSALKRGLGGLYDDEAVTYILRHGLKYYIAALSSNASLSREPPQGGEVGLKR